MSMFLTTQARSQPDVCTEHKQCYLARNISAKNLLFLIRKISSTLEQLYMDLYQVASWSIQPFGYNCRNATLLRVAIRLRTILSLA